MDPDMVLVAAWPMDINMAVTWVTDIDTDSCCCREKDPELAVAQTGTSLRPQVAVLATHIRLLLTTLYSSVNISS